MNNMIPNDIIVKAAKGDLESFETIYKASSGLVYNTAYRIVQNKEDAEEVTQEVFLKVYDALSSFRLESSLKTWVYRITVNLAINRYNKTAKEKERTVEYDDSHDPVQEETMPEMDKAFNKRTVDSLLEKLNPDQKACVVLREIEGLSYKEISDTLKIGMNTVRSRLKRARERFLKIGRGGVENEL